MLRPSSLKRFLRPRSITPRLKLRLPVYGLIAGTGLTLAGAGTVAFDLDKHASAPLSRVDPLSKLDPDTLASNTSHLAKLSIGQLCRSYLVFLACSNSFLVRIAPGTVDALESIRDNVPILGQLLWRPFMFVMRSTFFRQFVAGETAAEADPLLHQLRERSCGAMLNWSAEAVHSRGDHGPKGVLLEAVEELTRALEAISQFQPPSEPVSTILAVKITGLLADEKVFERASSALRAATSYQRGDSLGGQTLIPAAPILEDTDLLVIRNLYEELRKLCKLAQTHRTRIAFDAEQSWFQPCLDRLVSLLSSEFNKNDIVIYNTYQANLRLAHEAIQRDLRQAKEQGYTLGVKLVRGAYVEAENARAKQIRTESPVWPNKAATDACYDTCTQTVLDTISSDLLAHRRPTAAVILATHNPVSVSKALDQLRQNSLACDEGGYLNVDPRVRGTVVFAQLMAMADGLTSTMLDLLPRTSKDTFQYPMNSLYVPYGKIERVLPYLVRRAQENASIMRGFDTEGKSGAAGQRRAIGREIRQRLFPALF